MNLGSYLNTYEYVRSCTSVSGQRWIVCWRSEARVTHKFERNDVWNFLLYIDDHQWVFFKNLFMNDSQSEIKWNLVVKSFYSTNQTIAIRKPSLLLALAIFFVWRVVAKVMRRYRQRGWFGEVYSLTIQRIG